MQNGICLLWYFLSINDIIGAREKQAQRSCICFSAPINEQTSAEQTSVQGTSLRVNMQELARVRGSAIRKGTGYAIFTN